MKIAVSGGRDRELTGDELAALNALLDIYDCNNVFLVGDCPTGVDREIRSFYPASRVYEADWTNHGRAAGPLRNARMIEDADMLVAFPGGAGTRSAINEARKQCIPVLIWERP